MEITSFILGMLTISGMAAAVALVVGLVKIYKQSKKVELLENAMYKEIEHLYQRIDDLSRELDQRMNHNQADMCRHIEEEKRDTMSYIDSRIDKLQSKKETVK